jgi:hypothetical protein
MGLWTQGTGEAGTVAHDLVEQHAHELVSNKAT